MTYNRWRIRNDPNQRKKFIFYSYYVRRKKGPETKLFVITRDKYGIGRERRDVIWSVHRLCIPYRCINFSSFAKGSTFSRVFSLPSALFSFIRSFIYSFFSFFFFFASILHHPPFFSATPLKATQYLTRVKMTYIWSSVFFFFLPSETFHSETWIDHQDREPGMEFQIKKPFAYAINCFPLVSTWITKHIHARFFFNVCAAKPTTQPV